MAALANHQHSEELTDFDFGGSAPTVAPTATNVVPLNVALQVPSVPATPASELESFYGSIGKSDAETLRTIAARIRERDRAARAAIIDIGNDLITIKEGMTGHFDRWLKLEFDMSKATAWNYINAAEQFGSAPKVVELLPPGTVYKLAAKATPADLRKAIILEIESGAVPTKQDVEERIADARYQAAEAKREEQKQVEAERQKQEDEKAWQARAKELTDDGKTEAEIEKERKKWDNAKAAKVRAKQRAAAKREAEEKKRIADWKAEKEHEAANAKRIAASLLSALGPDKFEVLRSELSKAHAWNVIDAVKKMDPASIEAARNAIAEEKDAAETAITEAGNAPVAFGSF